MNAASTTLACTTPRCPNPATTVLPYHVPGDENDHVCADCLATYWDAYNSTDTERD